MKVLEQRAKYGAAEYRITARTSQFRKRIDQGANPSIRAFRVQRVTRVDAGVGKHAPHMQLRGRVFLPEMRVEGRELFGRSRGPDEIVAPGTAFGEVARAAFEVLSLDLGVFTEGEEDVEREIVVVEIHRRGALDRKTANDHGESHGEVKGIDRGFVDVSGPLTSEWVAPRQSQSGVQSQYWKILRTH